MADLDLKFLGGLQIYQAGSPLSAVSLRKGQALFSYLVVTGKEVSRSSLAGLFWPDLPENRARANLRKTLVQLKRHLNSHLLISRQAIAFNQDVPYWLDVDEFEAITAASSDTGRLQAAATLYQGDFLEGFYLDDAPPFDEWVLARRASLREGAIQTFSTLVSRFAGQAAYETAATYARQLLAIEPWHEETHRELMRLLALSGQRSAALVQYEICRRTLAEELGVEPSLATVSLYDDIRQGHFDQPVPATAPPSPPAEVETRAIHNLPAFTTTFIGRSGEIKTIRYLLLDPELRLLNLVGPGGCGKTRLAIASVETIVSSDDAPFADGIWYASLAPIDDPDGLLLAIGKALQIFRGRGRGDPHRRLLDYLANKQLLLVLDNFEQLIGDESAHLLAELLAQAPGLKLLITSRARLNISGEQIFVVPGLEIPDLQSAAFQSVFEPDLSGLLSSYSAVRLFQQSAQRGRPDFDLIAANWRNVVRICQLVEGLPLAIELAASWTALLSTPEIVAELEAGGGRELDILSAEWHDLPERQRSMRRVLDASWNLLSVEERDIFTALSVFRGGFTRQAAQQVSGSSLQTLLGLVHKSWLQRESGGRFQIHTLLCQYAETILRADPAAWQATKDAQAAYFAGLVQSHAQKMISSQQKAAFEIIHAEFENIRAAWLWLVEQRQFTTVSDQMQAGLFHFCSVCLFEEDLLSLVRAARDSYRMTTSEGDGSQISLATWLTIEAWLLVQAYTIPPPISQLKQAWQIVMEQDLAGEMGFWFVFLAYGYAWHVDAEVAQDRLRELIPSFRQHGDASSLALTLSMLGNSLFYHSNERQEAETYLLEALALYETLDEPSRRAHTLRILGDLMWQEQEYAQAEKYLTSAWTLFRQLGEFYGAGHAGEHLAQLYIHQGRFAKGFDQYNRLRRIFIEEWGDRRYLAYLLDYQADCLIHHGQIDDARRLIQEASALSYAIGNENGIMSAAARQAELCRLSGDERTARQWYRDVKRLAGQTGSTEHLASYYQGMGDLALSAKEYAEAARHFQKSHQLEEGGYLLHTYWQSVYSLCGLGRALTGLGQLQEARLQLVDALQASRHVADRGVSMIVLLAFARLLAVSSEWAPAVILAIFVEAYYASWNETKEQAARFLAKAKNDLPPHIIVDAQKKAAAFDYETIMAAINQLV